MHPAQFPDGHATWTPLAASRQTLWVCYQMCQRTRQKHTTLSNVQQRLDARFGPSIATGVLQGGMHESLSLAKLGRARRQLGRGGPMDRTRWVGSRRRSEPVDAPGPCPVPVACLDLGRRSRPRCRDRELMKPVLSQRDRAGIQMVTHAEFPPVRRSGSSPMDLPGSPVAVVVNLRVALCGSGGMHGLGSVRWR